ncbi:MAG TPA: hypothetical protein V6D17_15295 [Candidatus Obscuribacterales bacterium]
MIEGTSVRGLSAGLGAGTAAGLSKGRVFQRTYDMGLQAQQAVVAQTRAIENYVVLATQYEAKKQWENAEKCYTYALQFIARRDGPGSPKSAPLLENLARVCKEQRKINDAIGYQKTVVAFANASKVQSIPKIVQTQNDLSNLYISKGDFASAEPIARKSVELVRNDRSISPRELHATLRVYGEVLRGLHREPEAIAIESSIGDAAQRTVAAPTPRINGNCETATAPPEPASNPPAHETASETSIESANETSNASHATANAAANATPNAAANATANAAANATADAAANATANAASNANADSQSYSVTANAEAAASSGDSPGPDGAGRQIVSVSASQSDEAASSKFSGQSTGADESAVKADKNSAVPSYESSFAASDKKSEAAGDRSSTESVTASDSKTAEATSTSSGKEESTGQ